jgi:hypothetical protein
METHLTSDCVEKLQLFERYQKEVINVSVSERHYGEAKLIGPITEFLCSVEPRFRLTPAIARVFDINTNTDSMWDMAAAAGVFRTFEKYALNLIDYPWKHEFWTIRVS